MISVIVPIYNVEKFLPKCIESLIHQTYKDIEIALVDDGSPDRCPEICDDYASKDKRIKVIHQRNQGVSAARNAGLDIVKGEYIGFCDPDDWSAVNMYEKMLEAMDDSVDMVACGYDYYSEYYVLDQSRRYQIHENETMGKIDVYRKLADMPPTIRHGVVTKLFRKSILKGLKFDTNLKSAEDGNFLLDYLERIHKAVFVHEPLYNNLVREGSATHGGLNIQSLKDSFRVHNRMYEDSVTVDKGLKDYAIAFLLDVCTLKYNEAKNKVSGSKAENDSEIGICLSQMRNYIRHKALTAITSPYIGWKTKIYYLLLWIRK